MDHTSSESKYSLTSLFIKISKCFYLRMAIDLLNFIGLLSYYLYPIVLLNHSIEVLATDITSIKLIPSVLKQCKCEVYQQVEFWEVKRRLSNRQVRFLIEYTVTFLWPTCVKMLNLFSFSSFYLLNFQTIIEKSKVDRVPQA